MGANTHIEWCDHTFNPWEGCTKVSPGCANCYAEHRNARFGGGTAPNWGKGAPRRRTSASNWAQPVKWNEHHECCLEAWTTAVSRDPAAEAHRPARPRVFCASLADWLDDEVPIEWLADLLDLIRRTPHLDWLLLTKRPENWQIRIQAAMPAFLDDEHLHVFIVSWLSGHAPANVWIGTTVEDQTRADERIPALLRIPARVRFLSCEPLLERLDLRPWLSERVRCGCGGLCDALEPCPMAHNWVPPFHWVICGGESGTKARPMHPDWARSLRDECKAAGVPFLFKQWGEWIQAASDGKTITVSGHNPGGPRWPEWFTFPDGQMMAKMGKRVTGRLLDGVEHNGFPKGSR